ncbi:hypothetical protein IAU59_000512 [Kwoniella sp. CBS 9459]
MKASRLGTPLLGSSSFAGPSRAQARVVSASAARTQARTLRLNPASVRQLSYSSSSTSRLAATSHSASAPTSYDQNDVWNGHDSPNLPEADLLSLLCENPELSPEEAQNELRWIKDEVRQRSSEMLQKGQLPPVEDELVRSYVERRSQGEPLQYILGSTDFGPLTIKCVRPVLIPRPETAHCTSLLSQSILASIPPLTSAARPKVPMDVLDLCTGSGCIALLMARQNPLLSVRGVDNSPAAVALGMANASALQLEHRVTVRYGNLFADPKGLLPDSGWVRSDSASKSTTTPEGTRINTKRHEAISPRSRFLATEFVQASNGDSGIEAQGKRKVGLVVSNPPYIPYDQWTALPASVRKYESPSALLGDGDITKGNGMPNEAQRKGLKYYERIAEILPDLLIDHESLERDGWGKAPRLALEVGKGQAEDVQEIVRSRSSGMIGRTEIWEDQFGVERFVVGWTE